MHARMLHPTSADTPIPLADSLSAARAGAIVVVDGVLQGLGFFAPLFDAYVDAATDVLGPDVADRLRRHGLERLHDEAGATQVVAVLTAVERRTAGLAIPLTRAIVATLGPDVGNRYFVCPRLFVRALVPARVLAASPELGAQGHLDGKVGPVGLHRDRDLTHPAHSLSLSAALGRVREGNSVALGPFDSPATLIPVLEPGDLLLFDADRLHASVPNDTDETRVSVTTRVCTGRWLRYGPGTNWRPYADARLLETGFHATATWQSRANVAALRRWRWRRRWEAAYRREHPDQPVPSVRR